MCGIRAEHAQQANSDGAAERARKLDAAGDDAALLPTDGEQDSRRRVTQATDQILLACRDSGGEATIPWCPAEWKSALKVWGLDRRDLDQMRKLKEVFDPHGTLSPGRFVGGL